MKKIQYRENYAVDTQTVVTQEALIISDDDLDMVFIKKKEDALDQIALRDNFLLNICSEEELGAAAELAREMFINR